MSWIKENKFKSFLILGVVISGIFFAGYWNLKKGMEKLNDSLTAIDRRLEKTESRLATLQKEGFVERPSLELFSDQILSAVVFIHGAARNTSYNRGNSVITSATDSGVRGTGFFISKDGFIATAKHVVDGLDEKKINVQVGPDNFVEAEIYVKDDKTDLAILKATGNNFDYVELGFFDNIEVGEDVGLIGFNPGFDIPLTHKGSVSAKARENGINIFTINSFVNKGNSGSPVFSLKTGKVIGIVSARQSELVARQPIDLNGLPSMVSLGGIDPTRFTAEVYNDVLQLVTEASQVGIGIIYSSDELQRLLK